MIRGVVLALLLATPLAAEPAAAPPAAAVQVPPRAPPFSRGEDAALCEALALAAARGVSLLDGGLWAAAAAAAATATGCAQRGAEECQRRYAMLAAGMAWQQSRRRRAVASSVDSFQHALAVAVHGALLERKPQLAAAAACAALYPPPAAAPAAPAHPAPPNLFPAVNNALNSTISSIDGALHQPAPVASAVRTVLRSTTADAADAARAAVCGVQAQIRDADDPFVAQGRPFSSRGGANTGGGAAAGD